MKRAGKRLWAALSSGGDAFTSSSSRRSRNSPDDDKKNETRNAATSTTSPGEEQSNNQLVQQPQTRAIQELALLIYSRIGKEDDDDNNRPNQGDLFEAKVVPNLSIEEFASRIAFYLDKYCPNTGLSAIAGATKLLQRVVVDDPDFHITEGNCYNLLLAGVVLAQKFYQDKNPSLDFYAKLGGITVAEVGRYEMTLFKLLSFSLADLHEAP